MTALLVGILPAMAAPAEKFPQLKDLSLSRIEQRLAAIDAELEQLAKYSLRSGIGPVGYRSKPYEDSANTEWIQINLAEETPIDQIVLVPTIGHTEKGFIADGFPLEFSIIAGNREDPNGTAIAHFRSQDRLLPRIAPLVVPCSGTTASWIRIEATMLSPRAWDGKYILDLSEILVFNGQENMALKQPVQASSPGGRAGFARRIRFLVDGFVPYLMDSHLGPQSIAYVGLADIGDHLRSLTIDLETVYPLNRIHLHAVDLSDTVPISTPIGFGVPQRLRVDGAMHPDFSDAVRLIDYHKKTVYETGPIIMRRFPETPCRYVRLIAEEPYLLSGYLGASFIGFAEIELFSHSRNVAIGKAVHADFEPAPAGRSLAALTDGCNLYGQILPLRDWMNQLALRHDLETERPIVVAELNRRYAHQKVNLTRMKWLAALLGAGIIFTLLIDRILRMREVARIMERFAADLHDELGANLHTIGLLSDLAEQALDEPEELTMLHQRIRAVTKRTGTAMRHCAAMQEASELYTGLRADMERAAMRIMAKLEHTISIEGEEFLKQLKPRTRLDLFLFYKESLVNISRHSGATQFSTRLSASPREIHLTVSDNGHGIGESQGNRIPSSLKRRARLLSGRVNVESPATGGTSITLKLRTQRWGLRK